MIARWWPPIGLFAMLLLGWAVRAGPVGVDDWFQQIGADMGSPRRAFLAFSEPLALTVALAIGVGVALRQRRPRLALSMVIGPPVGLAIVEICKRIFGREKGVALCYPSGHTTFLVVVIGLLVLVIGAGVWTVLTAVVISLLGMFGQAINYHYFTDTIGATLLGTSVVGVVAVLACGERSEPVDSTSP